ncbi:NAD(+) salvage pathway protein [Dionaea muscipula]
MARTTSWMNFVTDLSIILSIFLVCSRVNAQLSANFYNTSCPNVETIVRNAMTTAVNNEARMGASILRLFFHDCFVQGCDGSVLLDDTATFTGEKGALSNNGSLRGFDVIDTIKANVEAACNATVSCADILALASRDGVFLLGGPSWTVLLGRRDSTTASLSEANTNLPGPTNDLSTLITKFAKKGLTAQDMTALSGAHTIGQARCLLFRSRIYNDTDINATYATGLQANCPVSGGDDNLAPLDLQTPTNFDNDYYQNLLNQQGLLHSDQELFNGGSQDSLAQTYANDNSQFLSDFVNSMINVGNISPLTGTQGQIRLNCRAVNS